MARMRAVISPALFSSFVLGRKMSPSLVSSSVGFCKVLIGSVYTRREGVSRAGAGSSGLDFRETSPASEPVSSP